MKFIEPVVHDATHNFRHNSENLATANHNNSKSLSDDEGVCDLDIDLLISGPCTPPRIISRAVKGRYAARSESPSLVKEKLINMTQSKLKSAEANHTDGLRNKVLLEAALKRCLTQASAEKRSKLLIDIGPETQLERTMSVNDLSRCSSNMDQNSPAVNHYRVPLGIRSAPCSPRKRSFDTSVSDMMDSQLADLSCAMGKRIKASFQDGSDDIDSFMDTCDTYIGSPRKDELFADLANVFYRLKTHPQ